MCQTASQLNTVSTNHGGLAVLYRSSLKISRCILPPVNTFECLALNLAASRSHRRVTLLSVYRPGSAAVTSEFFDELQLVLAAVQSAECSLVVVGDFNIHVDVPADFNTVQLNDILK